MIFEYKFVYRNPDSMYNLLPLHPTHQEYNEYQIKFDYPLSFVSDVYQECFKKYMNFTQDYPDLTPDICFVGRETYKALTQLESETTGLLVFPESVFDIRIILVPNVEPFYCEFGVSQLKTQLELEQIKRTKGSSK